MRIAWILSGATFAGAAAATIACGSGEHAASTIAPGADAGTDGAPTVIVRDAGAELPTCSEASKQVYLLSAANDLFAFTPATITLKKIGRLACPDPGKDVATGVVATPNAMTIDRHGTAWVSYTSGKLYTVDTSNAACTATAFVAGQGGIYKFAMAFATTAAGADDETLFASGFVDSDAGPRGQGLATIDRSTFAMTKRGDFSGALKLSAAELTGTGGGELWGLFTTSPASLVPIEPHTGATGASHPMSGVETGTAWAFAFWGGDFWVFTAQPNENTHVTRVEPAKSFAVTPLKLDMGFRVVGAGVSTCAPLTPPK